MTSVEPIGGRTLAGDDPRLTITPLDGLVGLRLAGEIDIATTAELERALRPLAETPGDVHLDLSDVAFIDVAGARVLASFAAAHAGRAGHRLLLHHPPYLLLRMIDLLWTGAPGLEVRP